MDIIGESRVKELMRIACTRNGLDASFADKVSVQFMGNFTSRMGDAHYGKMRVRFSLPLFLRASNKDQEDTVVHEMCHIIAAHKYGVRIKPHGKEWKLCMVNAGYAPTRCHSVDRTGLAKTRKTMKTQCGCRTHMVTPNMYRKISAGQSRICRICKGRLHIA